MEIDLENGLAYAGTFETTIIALERPLDSHFKHNLALRLVTALASL